MSGKITDYNTPSRNRPLGHCQDGKQDSLLKKIFWEIGRTYEIYGLQKA